MTTGKRKRSPSRQRTVHLSRRSVHDEDPGQPPLISAAGRARMSPNYQEPLISASSRARQASQVDTPRKGSSKNVAGTKNIKCDKKNERRRRNLHRLADRQQVPSLGVHVNFYLLQALPFGLNARGKVTVPDLLANARLFFTRMNCLDGVVEQVYNRTGGFQERFRTVFSNTIQHQQHLKYHKKTRESLAHVTGEFVYTPWLRDQRAPKAVLQHLVDADAARTVNKAHAILEKASSNEMHWRDKAAAEASLAKTQAASALREALEMKVRAEEVEKKAIEVQRKSEISKRASEEKAAAAELARRSAEFRCDQQALVQKRERERQKAAEEDLAARIKYEASLNRMRHVQETDALQRRLAAETAARRAAEEAAGRAAEESEEVRASKSASVQPEQQLRPPSQGQEQQSISIVGFKFPSGLAQDFSVTNVPHTFLLPTLSPSASASLSDFAIIVDFEAAGSCCPIEIGCVVINRERKIVAEFARQCCPQTLGRAGASYGEQLTGYALPPRPKKRCDQMKMQELTSSEREHTKASFMAFLQQAVGINYLQFSIYAKDMSQERKCFDYLGMEDFSLRLQDMCPNNPQINGAFPFRVREGPGNTWLKHGIEQQLVGKCIGHTSIGQGGIAFHHCALEDCRSYALALREQFDGVRDPTKQQVVSTTAGVGVWGPWGNGGSSWGRFLLPNNSNSTSSVRTSGWAAPSTAIETVPVDSYIAPTVLPRFLWIPAAETCFESVGEDKRFMLQEVPYVVLSSMSVTSDRRLVDVHRTATCGMGAFAAVYSCMFLFGSEDPNVPSTQPTVEGAKKHVLKVAKGDLRQREVRIHCQAKHDNIVNCDGHGSYAAKGGGRSIFYLLLERMDTSLHMYGLGTKTEGLVKPYRDFSRRDILIVMWGLRDALNYLHTTLKVAHLDLHAGNFLVNYNAAGITGIKLCDFGKARPFPKNSRRGDHWLESEKGAAAALDPGNMLPCYAPEIYQYDEIGAHTDVFGYTVTCLHVLLDTCHWKVSMKRNPRTRKFLIETGVQGRFNTTPRAQLKSKKLRAAMTNIDRILGGELHIRRGHTLDYACAQLEVVLDHLRPPHTGCGNIYGMAPRM